MSNKVGLPKHTYEIYFAGAGIDGEKRYELCGLSADTSILTLPQLYEELKDKGGISEPMINRYRQEIEALPTARLQKAADQL